MSDGLTDGYKAQRRWEELEQYFCAVEDYVIDPDQSHLDSVIAAAKPIGGYKGIEAVVTELAWLTVSSAPENLATKKAVWARLLFKAKESAYFKDLKELSPFKDQIIAFVDYGIGFIRLYGDVNKFFSKPIADRGWQTFDCDKYVVIMPEPKPEDVEVFWTSSGIGGVTGPRQADLKSNRIE